MRGAFAHHKPVHVARRDPLGAQKGDKDVGIVLAYAAHLGKRIGGSGLDVGCAGGVVHLLVKRMGKRLGLRLGPRVRDHAQHVACEGAHLGGRLRHRGGPLVDGMRELGMLVGGVHHDHAGRYEREHVVGRLDPPDLQKVPETVDLLGKRRLRRDDRLRVENGLRVGAHRLAAQHEVVVAHRAVHMQHGLERVGEDSHGWPSSYGNMRATTPSSLPRVS